MAKNGGGPREHAGANALAEFMNRPASCCLNRRWSGMKKPAQLALKRVSSIRLVLDLAVFIKRPQAETNWRCEIYMPYDPGCQQYFSDGD